MNNKRDWSWVKDAGVALLVAAVMALGSGYITTRIMTERIEHAASERGVIRAVQEDQRATIDQHSVSIGRHEERMRALERSQKERWDEVRERLDTIEDYLRRGQWRPPRD